MKAIIHQKLSMALPQQQLGPRPAEALQYQKMRKLFNGFLYRKRFVSLCIVAALLEIGKTGICLADEWPGECTFSKYTTYSECKTYDTVQYIPGEDPVPYGEAYGQYQIDKSGFVTAPLKTHLSSRKEQAIVVTTYYWDKERQWWVGQGGLGIVFSTKCYPDSPYSPLPPGCSAVPTLKFAFGPPDCTQ